MGGRVATGRPYAVLESNIQPIGFDAIIFGMARLVVNDWGGAYVMCDHEQLVDSAGRD